MTRSPERLRLAELRLRNFRGHADTRVRLHDGLTGVVGPERSGKSSLLEGIAWALCGETGLRRGTDALRHRGAPPGATAEAELTLETGEGACRIVRTPAGGRVFGADGTLVHESVAVWLESVTGLGRDALYHACFADAAELAHAMDGAAAAERRRALEESAATEQREIGDEQARIDTLRQAPELVRQYTEELAAAREGLREAEAAVDALRTEWSGRRREVSTKLESYRRRAREIRDAISKLKEAGDRGACPTCARPLGEELDNVVQRLEDEYMMLVQDGRWLGQREAQLAAAPADLAAAVAQRDERVADVEERAQLLARCEQAVQELWTLAGEQKRRQERLAALRAEISRLPGAAPPQRGPALPLIVIDDVLAGLDADRRARTLATLRRLAEQCGQAIVATHVAAAAAGFDHLLRVRFDAGAGVTDVSPSPAS